MALPQRIDDDEEDYKLTALQRAENKWGITSQPTETPENDLNESEEDAPKKTAKEKATKAWGEEPTLYNNDSVESDETDSGDVETPFSFKNKGRTKGKAKLSRKQKILLSVFGSSSLFFIILIVGILAFFSSQKIVQLAENITVYNMARTARTLRLAQSEVLEENIASNTISDGRIAALKARFDESKIGTAVEKFNKLRPEKVFKNLNKTLEPHYEPTGEKNLLGFEKKTFTGYDYTSKDGTVTFIEKADQKFFSFKANSLERVRFANELNAAVDSELQGVSNFVRSRAIKKLLADKGIKLRWWDKLGSEYNGLTPEEAARYAQKQAAEAIRTTPEGGCQTPVTCGAAQETLTAEEKALQDAVDNPQNKSAAAVTNQTSETVAKELEASVTKRGLTGVLDKTSVIYSIALPLCLIYDGSLENSKEPIDANQTALEKSYFSVRSAADQIKAGDINATAVGGFNDKIGDISNSVPELRASGKAVDTSTQVSPLELPQSNANGTFSLSHLALPPAAAAALDTVLIPGCGFMTDLRTGVVLTVAETLATLFSGGGSKVGEEGAKEGVSLALEKIVTKLTFKETRAEINRTSLAYVLKQAGKKYIIKTGLMVGATVGLTELAKMAVLKHMGEANTGLATDATFANQADMGGNLYAQESNRTLGGRPLTTEEINESKQADLAYIQGVNGQKSIGERYFALSNPSSLISKAGFSSYSFLTKKGGVASSIISSIGSLFASPSKFFNIGALYHNPTAHAMTVGSGDYNILQFGWSNKELDLVDNNPDTYSPMINSLELDHSQKKDEIEKKYGRCLTDSIATLLTGGGEGDPAIYREDDGSVIPDKGLCSPVNLGIDNAEFGPQMVFRWRLSKLNDTTYQQLFDIANPSDGEDTLPPTTTTPTQTASSLSIEGLNGYAIPCTGEPHNVIRKTLAYPSADWSGLKDSGTIGTTSDGKPIKVYIREACDTTNVKTVVIVSSIHGSENGGQLVSHELLYNAQLPANVRVVAIPELNGSGIATGTRKNSNGVDLNRNNDYLWSSLTNPQDVSPGGKTYRGSGPASEPETQAIDNFLTSLGKVNLSIHYHDNLNYVASVGSTPSTIAVSYANTTGMAKGNTNGTNTVVTQRGSLDAWYNKTTGTPALLIEMSSDQSAAVINKHVEAVKNLLSGGLL